MERMGDEHNVTKLPVRFKPQAPDERTLLRPWEVGKSGGCSHDRFVVDEKKSEVECADCKEKLNPMWVLVHLAAMDSRMREASKRYKDEMARLSDRSRTKCEHCGKMTGISRR